MLFAIVVATKLIYERYQWTKSNRINSQFYREITDIFEFIRLKIDEICAIKMFSFERNCFFKISKILRSYQVDISFITCVKENVANNGKSCEIWRSFPFMIFSNNSSFVISILRCSFAFYIINNFVSFAASYHFAHCLLRRFFYYLTDYDLK